MANKQSLTDVLDLGKGEIYSESHLIPSSGLPFSGSSQSGETSGVPKYYFRQRLIHQMLQMMYSSLWFRQEVQRITPSKLIQDGQQGSFISPSIQ